MSGGGNTQRRKGAGCEGVACEHTLGEQPLHLYGYLWVKPQPSTRGKRDDHGGDGGGDKGEDDEDADGDDDCGRFGAVVTDTVVFKHQKPIKWLFTSKQEKGKILCKSKKSLSIGQVLQEFLVPKLYTRGTRSNEDELVLATFAYTERSTVTGELQLIVEHLDKTGLNAVILNRDKPALSVLQRFIPTKSGYNHMIQSVFTPESCAIRKCVNANLIVNTKLSVTQRTITFEADENDLRARDVTNKELQHSIERIHLEFSAHLEKIVGKEIVRNVAYFKVKKQYTGADDRIYLLWSTMISFERPGKTFAKNHRLALSSAERHRQCATLQEINHASKLLGLYSQLKCCPVCNQMLPRSQVDFLVTYKSIIRYSESEVNFIRGRGGQTVVPAIILNICGPMKRKRFEQLKQDTTFLYQTIHLCQQCSQKLTLRQKEAPAAIKKDEERLAEAPTAPQPPEKSSAHALFWGKVAREAKQKSEIAAPKARSFSAGIPRVRFQRSSLTSPHSSRQFQRHLPQLPSVVVQVSAPLAQQEGAFQDSIEDIAQHLQRAYHRPSIRFALAQCSIFPSDSIIPVSALGRICSPEMVTAILKHWSELCKSRGDTTEPTTIDIDSFDGVLMNRMKSSQGAHTDEDGRLHGGIRTTRDDISSEHAPVRPTRPKSSSSSMTSSRANSFMTRFMGGTCGDPRRVTIQTNIKEVSIACNEDESTKVLRVASSQVKALESPTVQASEYREETATPSFSSSSQVTTAEITQLKKQESCRVDSKLFPAQSVDQVFVLCVHCGGKRQIGAAIATHDVPQGVPTSQDYASACTTGVPMTHSSKQHESGSLAHSLKQTPFKQPTTSREDASNELSEEEMRVLEETLKKCG